jgi:hypothetical protein
MSGVVQFELVEYIVVMTVDVFAPSHWTAEYFLEAVENWQGSMVLLQF